MTYQKETHREIIFTHQLQMTNTLGSMFQSVKNDIRPFCHLYKNNKIKTTKYTWRNFVIKNLYEQMHRLANVYFLFIAILNFVPLVNAVNKWLGMMPLLVVLFGTGIKDAYEDCKRHRYDVKVNTKKCRVYSW